MQFTPGIFAKLLEPISRRRFQSIVDLHNADAYDKSFGSYDHLIALMFAQFSSADSLRGLEASWNAASNHHYHLGSGPLARSTLSDANHRRPTIVFAEAFAELVGQLDRHTRQEGREMVRLIDSTPIPLGKLCVWAKSNGRRRHEDARPLRSGRRSPTHHRCGCAACASSAMKAAASSAC